MKNTTSVPARKGRGGASAPEVPHDPPASCPTCGDPRGFVLTAGESCPRWEPACPWCDRDRLPAGAVIELPKRALPLDVAAAVPQVVGPLHARVPLDPPAVPPPQDRLTPPPKKPVACPRCGGKRVWCLDGSWVQVCAGCDLAGAQLIPEQQVSTRGTGEPETEAEYERMTLDYWRERVPDLDDVTVIVRREKRPVRSVLFEATAPHPAPSPAASGPPSQGELAQRETPPLGASAEGDELDQHGRREAVFDACPLNSGGDELCGMLYGLADAADRFAGRCNRRTVRAAFRAAGLDPTLTAAEQVRADAILAAANAVRVLAPLLYNLFGAVVRPAYTLTAAALAYLDEDEAASRELDGEMA